MTRARWLLAAALGAAACAPVPSVGPIPQQGLAPGEAPVDRERYALQAIAPLAIAAVTVDSEVGGQGKARMLDNNLSTQWTNGGYRNANSWAVLELTQRAALTSLSVKTGPSKAARYDIQVSDDGVTWTTVVAGQANTTWNMEAKTVPAGSLGRFVRLFWHNSPTTPEAHWSIYEISLLGEPAPAPTPGPSATTPPSESPSVAPTAEPSTVPSTAPSESPSVSPSASPSVSETPTPTPTPSVTPTPTQVPTSTPTPSATPTPVPAGQGPVPLTRVDVAGQAIASSGTPWLAIDGDPATYWSPAAGLPQWLAVPLTRPVTGPLLIQWHTSGYHYLNNSYAPRSYAIQVSSDSTDGRNGTWYQVQTATDNPVRSRVDTIQASGARWVKLVFTTRWMVGPYVREIEVLTAPSASPLDAWLILGDSITAQSFDPGKPNLFPGRVQSLTGIHRPLLIGGGTGGDTAGDGLAKLSAGLPLSPAGSFVGLAYGTNDATRKVPVPTFKSQLQQMIDQIKASGRTPMIARTPWNLNGTLPQYVQAIDELRAANNLPAGPDLYNYFRTHREELKSDSVHMTPTGEQSIQRLWAEAVARAYQ